MSKEDIRERQSPLGGHFSTAKSSLTDLTMSRVDSDPSFGVERGTDAPGALDLDTPSMLDGEGLLGAVGLGSPRRHSGSATSSPEEERTRVRMEQNVPGPLGKYRLQWGGVVGTEYTTAPWRPLPGRHQLDMDQEGPWHPLPEHTSTIGSGGNLVDSGHEYGLDPSFMGDYQASRVSMTNPLPRRVPSVAEAPRDDVSHRGGYEGMSLPSLPLWFAGLCLWLRFCAISLDNTTAFVSILSYTKGPVWLLRARG